MTKKKKIIIAVCLVLAVVLLAAAYFIFAPKGTAGTKSITVTVIANGDVVAEYSIKTDEEFLRAPLEKEGIIEGTESEYGLFVTKAAGIEADSNSQWWCFTKGGEMLNTGVDSTPIADGDSFEITLTDM